MRPLDFTSAPLVADDLVGPSFLALLVDQNHGRAELDRVADTW